jgi:hypothetical protein
MPPTLPFDEMAAGFADFILSKVRASGAIITYPSTHVEPTWGHQACFGLVEDRRHHRTIRNWLQWCADRLNSPDANNVYGTLNSYDVSGATEVIGTQADADDTACAHFLTCCKELFEKGDATSRKFVRDIQRHVEVVATALEQLLQANGLAIARYNFAIQYGMDNCEVYQGLKNMAYLCGAAFNSAAGAAYYQALADACLAGIEANLWDATQARYKVAVGLERTSKGRVGGISGNDIHWYKGRISAIGGAVKGRVASIAGATVTLVTAGDAANFAVNDRVYFDPSLVGATPRSGIPRVLSINLGAGTVTFSTSLATTVPAAVANDYLFPNTITVSPAADAANFAFSEGFTVSSLASGGSLRTGNLTAAEAGNATTGVVQILTNSVLSGVTGLAVNDYCLPTGQANLLSTFAVRAGDVLVLDDTSDGSSLRTGSLTVSAVNTTTGIVTCSGPVTTGVPAAVAMDYVFRESLIYADNTVQLFPILCGVLEPTSARALALWARFKVNLPNAALHDMDGDVFIHANILRVAQLMNDREWVATYIEKAYRENLVSGSGTFYTAEAGWLMKVALTYK